MTANICFDFNKDFICLTCLKTDAEYISVYDFRVVEDNVISVQELLKLYTSLKEIDFLLPSNLCKHCVAHLEGAHRFNELYLKSRKFLTDHLYKKEDVDPHTSPALYEKPLENVIDNLYKQPKTLHPIIADSYLASKTPKEIKILPKANPIVLKKLTIDQSPVIMLQPVEDPALSQTVTYEITSSLASGFSSCSHCPKQFISAECLRYHEDNYHPDILRCVVCSVKFESDDALQQHNMAVHLTPTLHMCGKCPKMFRTARALELHKGKAHREKIEEMEAHPKSKTMYEDSDDEDIEDGPIECKLCGVFFKIYKHYRLHKIAHKPNVCPKCNSGFPNKAELMAHTATHDPARPFSCVCCQRGYKSRQALMQHHRNQHEMKEQAYFCGLCPKVTESYLDLATLREHLQQHRQRDNVSEEDRTRFAADNVNFQNELEKAVAVNNEPPEFGVSKDMQGVEIDEGGLRLETVETEKDEEPSTVQYYVVDDDNGVNLVEITAEQAKLLVSGQTLEDASGSKVLELDGETDTPEVATEGLMSLEALSSEGLFFEPAAETPKASEDQLQERESSNVQSIKTVEEENTSERKHACHLCTCVMTRRYNLMRHMAHAHKLYTIRCVYCKAKFNNLSLYEVHRMKECRVAKEHAKNPVEKKKKALQRYPECPICHVKFKRKQLMFAHVRAEHGRDAALETDGEQYLCKLCDKRISTRAGFSYHMRRHYGYPQYACQLCPRRFTAAPALRNHIAGKHTQQRPHLCQLCGRSFVSADHLRKHLRLTHGGRRDFLCNVCGLTFQQSSHVRQHQWVHTGVKPHACRYCSSSYSSHGALKKHYFRMHNEEYVRDLRDTELRYRRMEEADRRRELVPRASDTKDNPDDEAEAVDNDLEALPEELTPGDDLADPKLQDQSYTTDNLTESNQYHVSLEMDKYSSLEDARSYQVLEQVETGGSEELETVLDQNVESEQNLQRLLDDTIIQIQFM